MFTLLFSVILALFTGIDSTSTQSATQAAPGAATVTRVVQSDDSKQAPSVKGRAQGNTFVFKGKEDGDDEPTLDEIQEIVIAELASLDGIDETIATAVRAAMQGIESAKPAIRTALTSMGNSNVWRMRTESVEYDENAAFFGVGTEPISPQTSAQLPITSGTGLIVTHVSEGSPAATAGLKQLDVLARLNDQMLVNGEQLAVLLRSHKPGDEVSVTYLRGGKESTAKVKLDSRKLPKLGPGGARADGGIFDSNDDVIMVEPNGGSSFARFFGPSSSQPMRLHGIHTAGKAPVPGPRGLTWVSSDDEDADVSLSTLNDVNMNYTTDNVAIIYTSGDGAVHMSVTDAKSNKVLFDESRTPSKEELEAMPAAARADVERMLKDTQGPKVKIRRGNPGRAGAPAAAPTPPVPPMPPAPPSPPAPQVDAGDDDQLM